MIIEVMKQRMSCGENSKWHSKRPGEDKTQGDGRNTAVAKLEGKAGIHMYTRQINTHRHQLLGEGSSQRIR